MVVGDPFQRMTTSLVSLELSTDDLALLAGLAQPLDAEILASIEAARGSSVTLASERVQALCESLWRAESRAERAPVARKLERLRERIATAMYRAHREVAQEYLVAFRHTANVKNVLAELMVLGQLDESPTSVAMRVPGLRTRFTLAFTADECRAVAESRLLGKSRSCRFGKLQSTGGTLSFTFAQLEQLWEEISLSAPIVPEDFREGVLSACGVVLDALDPVKLNEEGNRRSARRHSAAPRDAVYRLKVSLVGSDPCIWRRIETRDCDLESLHDMIQVAFQWDNAHLHVFRVGKRLYAANGRDSLEDTDDSFTIYLSHLVNARHKKFEYVYDLGDSWRHAISFEQIVEAESDATYPRCVDGRRAGPVESCGGIAAYGELLAALATDRDQDRHRAAAVLGSQHDAERFSVNGLNEELWRYFAPRRKARVRRN